MTIIELGQGEFRSDLARLYCMANAVLEHAPPQHLPDIGEHHNRTLYETGLVFTLMNPWPTDRAKAMLANWRRVRAEEAA